MNFDLPDKPHVIYTKKKCAYCTRAKVLLPQACVVSCDDWLQEDRDAFLKRMDELSGATPRTFPMVFVGGRYIGGYEETKKYVDELECFKLVDF